MASNEYVIKQAVMFKLRKVLGWGGGEERNLWKNLLSHKLSDGLADT